MKHLKLYFSIAALTLSLAAPITAYGAEETTPVTEALPPSAAEDIPEAPAQESTPAAEPELPKAPAQEQATVAEPAESAAVTYTVTEPSESATDTYTVTALSLTCYASSEKGLRVRSGPSTDYDILGTLSYGTRIEVTGECDGWYALSYNGTTGFVSAQYTSTDAPATSVSDNAAASAETSSTEASTTPDETEASETLSIFGDSTLVILLIAIIAVIVLIVLSLASFFRKPPAASAEYEEEYPDEEYEDEYDKEEYTDDEYADEEYDEDYDDED